MTSSAGAHGFRDREEAGTLLGQRLLRFAHDDPVVVGLPRGGVPVAFRVAATLHAPLDVIVVRKLGVPGHPEVAMGAVGENDALVCNMAVKAAAGVTDAEFAAVEAEERQEVLLRATRLRQGRPMTPLSDRTVIIVDDGIATGATARAAINVAHAHGARRVVVAVPVGAPDALRMLEQAADEVIAVAAPSSLWAVGAWYRNFDQVPDATVIDLLEQAGTPPAGPA